jgi:hypothetical protein
MNDTEKTVIEEIARIICGNDRDCRDCGHNSAVRECGCLFYAKRIYEQDYRKQSGWISVEERLPDNCRAVLVAVEGLTIGGAPEMVIGSYSGGFWMIADADGTHYLTKYMRYVVTHWMPLPEPPRGRGGREEKEG